MMCAPAIIPPADLLDGPLGLIDERLLLSAVTHRCSSGNGHSDTRRTAAAGGGGVAGAATPAMPSTRHAHDKQTSNV